MVPVPFPTFDKFQLLLRIYTVDHKSTVFKRPIFEKNLAFLQAFYKEIIGKFHKICCKMWRKKMLMEEIKYTILHCVCEMRTFVIPFYYGSGSAKVRNYITAPVPLRG